MSDHNKKYYWIKLQTNFFNQDTIDFLLSQKNGCQYVVLYQMLCLNTANNNGILATNMGEMIIPYDIEKIVRDTKYFDIDTVRVALELYKTLGMIYEEQDKVLRISNITSMIGSESANREAVKKREYRLKKKEENALGTNKGTNCPIEIEYRDKSIDIDIDINKKENIKKKKDFVPPTLEEIKDYCLKRQKNVNYKKFYDYYTENNWKDNQGKQVNNWKLKVISWEGNTNNSYGNNNYAKKEFNIPEWFGQEIEETPMTKEQQREFEELMSYWELE